MTPILLALVLADLAWLAADPQAHASGVVGQINIQAILAFFVSGLINWMRNSNASWLKWINPSTPQIAKLLSAVSAFLIACGIAISHSGTFSSPEGMTIVIAGLSLTGLVNGVSTFIGQWMAQHVAYEAIWQKPG